MINKRLLYIYITIDKVYSSLLFCPYGKNLSGTAKRLPRIFLHIVICSIQSILLKQFSMSALRDTLLRDHNDLIRITDRRKPVRDRNGIRFFESSSRLFWIQRSLSLSRALVASSRIRIGGFLERIHVQWRSAASVRRKGACATFSDISVVFIRKLHDKVMDTRTFGGFDDLHRKLRAFRRQYYP